MELQQQRQDDEVTSTSWTDFDRPFEKGLSISKKRRSGRPSKTRKHHARETSSSSSSWMEAPTSQTVSVPIMAPPKKAKSASTRSSSTTRASSRSGGLSPRQPPPEQSQTKKKNKSKSIIRSTSLPVSEKQRSRSTSRRSKGTTTLPDDMIRVLEIPLQTNPPSSKQRLSVDTTLDSQQKKKSKKPKPLPISPTSVPGTVSRGRSALDVGHRRRSNSAVPSGRATSRGRSAAPVTKRHPPLTKENFNRKVRSRSTSLTRVTRPTNTAEGISTPLPQHLTNNTSSSSLMEKLFGNAVERPTVNAITGSLGHEIRPRILLAATVYHNTASDLWITTINTNQRGISKNPALANKFLKAFSFASEQEAKESAIANAPPKMISKNSSPYCFCCKGNFAVFRRAGHCRNCGVCICNNCSVSWPSKLLPDTYNLKHEKVLRICISCNSLSLSFKKAILEGDLEEAIAIYGTGNVNLRTPFPITNKKEELMYPVHCAVEGGNLGILQWLIDDHFCPIKVFHNRAKRQSLILTSRNRSVLTIALEAANVEMLRYLVVECGLNLQEVRDLKSTVRSLENALNAMPVVQTGVPTTRPHTPHSTRWDHASFDDFSEPSSLGADEHFGDESLMSNRSRTSDRNGESSCIICCDRKIDCVATPCGHQVCCLTCSANLSCCPVCNDKTNFIKIFRP